MAVAGVLLGGIPMAVLGLALARRREPHGKWAALVRWCTVFQLSNLVLVAVLVVIASALTVDTWPDVVPVMLLLLLLGLASLSALGRQGR